MRQRMSGEFFATAAVVVLRLAVRWLGLCHPKKLAAAGELPRTMAIAEQAVIANAMKPLGQDMQEEAADELIGGEGHVFLSIVVAIVFPSEADPAVVDVTQAIVGNGDAMGISPDVFEDLLRSCEGRLGKDDPLGSSQRSKILPERATISQGLQGGKEPQRPDVEGLLQVFQEQTTKEGESTRTGRKNAGRQEIHRPPSGERPPPVTTQCKCGCSVKVCPQVWSTAKNPISAPKCLGSAAMVCSVSAAALKRMP